MQENCKEQFQVHLVDQAQNLGASTLQTADGLIFQQFFHFLIAFRFFDQNFCHILPKYTITFRDDTITFFFTFSKCFVFFNL